MKASHFNKLSSINSFDLPMDISIIHIVTLADFSNFSFNKQNLYFNIDDIL